MLMAQSPAQKEKTDDPAGQVGQSNKPAPQMSSPTGANANSNTFTGTIVNADCSQASTLTNTSLYADRSAPSSTSPATSSTGQDASASSKSTTDTSKASSVGKDYKSVYDREREVLKRCPANNSTTAFAIVTDAGSFYKLDDAGNTQVTSQAGSDSDKKKKAVKNMRVTVTGMVQGDTLKVQSLTKTDKKFGES